MCFRKSDAGEERGEYQLRKIFRAIKQQDEQDQRDLPEVQKNNKCSK